MSSRDDWRYGLELSPLRVRGEGGVVERVMGLARALCAGCGKHDEVTTWDRLCERCGG